MFGGQKARLAGPQSEEGVMSDRTAQTELPPPMVFMQLLFGKQLTYSLSGVARLGVADHMDKTGRAVEELAAKVGAHAPSLYRVMRMLASLGVFKESPPRHFALTPVGELLKTDAPGLAPLHGDDVRRGILDARLRTFHRMSAHRRRRRERSLRQGHLAGPGRAPRAMRGLPERDDRQLVWLGSRHRRGLRFRRHRADRRCRRRPRAVARLDPTLGPENAGHIVRPPRGGGKLAQERIRRP